MVTNEIRVMTRILLILVAFCTSSCATGGYCKHWNNPSAQDIEKVDESTDYLTQSTLTRYD
jgi:hypothetical protein